MAEELTELQSSLVDEEVKKAVAFEKAKKDGKVKTVDELKAMTTKELTKQVAFLRRDVNETADVLRAYMQRIDTIDAAAYLACASLDAKGNLMGIKKLNPRQQDRVARKIDVMKKVIHEYEDVLQERMKAEAEKRTKEALKDLEKKKEDEKSD